MIEFINELNSITKYPSIETFHKLGQKGRLTEELNFEVPKIDKLIFTEKIGGGAGCGPPRRFPF